MDKSVIKIWQKNLNDCIQWIIYINKLQASQRDNFIEPYATYILESEDKNYEEYDLENK